MSNFKNTFVIIVLLFFNVSTSIVHGQSVFDKINFLLQKTDFQELNRLYPQIEDSITDDFGKYVIKGTLLNSMNQYYDAFKCYDYLINKYSTMYDMTDYLNTATYCLINMGQYKDAKQYIERFYYKDTLQQNVKIPFPENFPILRSYTLAYALQDCDSSYLVRKSNKPIIVNMDVNNGLWFVPGYVNGEKESFLMDTGGSGTLVSEDFARKHDIQLLSDSIQIEGVNGVGYAQIGFIDSITIGDLSYHNVYVSVLPALAPDMKEHFGIQIDAILGTPFLQKVGVVEIYPKKKQIVFPIVKNIFKPDMKSNISIWGNIILIEMSVDSIGRQIAYFDSGSLGGVDIAYGLFEKNQDKLKKYSFEKKKVGVLGIHDKVDTTYVWQSNKPIPISIGDKNVEIGTAGSFVNSKFPCVGVSFLNKLDKISIDLYAMKITVE